MALNLTQLFTSLGRVGRTAYLINTGQAPQGVPFTELAAESWINPEWVAQLALAYDPAIRSESSPMASWSAAATTILQQLVAADNPVYGQTLSSALSYLLAQMTAQTKTVQECTVGDSVTAYSTNVGTGTVFVTLQRPDGLIQQNTIAESSALLITADSYTGGAAVGREPWQWSGSPNNSSLGTGTTVGLWDWDWPQGSGVTASGAAISAAQDAQPSGNYLTNGDFEDWSADATPVLESWYLASGTWGTDAQRSASGLTGYCVQFNAGTGATERITQQFGSTVSDGTDATAGTTPSPSAFANYAVSFWLKAAGVVSGGVLTVKLVDGTGATINDQAGTPNSTTVALTGLSTSWTNHTAAFRLPAILPAVVRLSVGISTALTGAAVLLDDVCFAAPVNLYAGGPYLAVFSNPAAPFENTPVDDGWTIAFTNDYGGATYGATWQLLLNRLFQTPAFLAPYSGSPNIADTLITGA